MSRRARRRWSMLPLPALAPDRIGIRSSCDSLRFCHRCTWVLRGPSAPGIVPALSLCMLPPPASPFPHGSTLMPLSRNHAHSHMLTCSHSHALHHAAQGRAAVTRGSTHIGDVAQDGTRGLVGDAARKGGVTARRVEAAGAPLSRRRPTPPPSRGNRVPAAGERDEQLLPRRVGGLAVVVVVAGVVVVVLLGR